MQQPMMMHAAQIASGSAPLSPMQQIEGMRAAGQMNGTMFGMDYGEVSGIAPNGQ